MDVAIKLVSHVALTPQEAVNTKHPQLCYESRLYKHLAGEKGIPQVYWFGTENKNNIMVIDLLGPSLEDLFNLCGRKFSTNTVLMIGVQMVCAPPRAR